MIGFLLAGGLMVTQGGQCPSDTKLLLPLIAEAIEDELYDLSRQGDYFQIDGTSGGSNSTAEIGMFVSKTLAQNCVGVVVYKDMPVGEIYRYFTFSNGTVILSGDPESKFPPTGGSMLTVYMPSREVADFIVSKSYEYKFAIDPNVSIQRLSLSSKRQQERIKFSFRLGR